jgi:uncharacterized protein DUF6542
VWGTRPSRLGPITVIFGALAGGLLTILAGFEPGWLLGLFVIIATAAGATAVRRTSAYLIIPVPAVAYFVVAMIAGLIHDRAADNSRAVLAVNALQWMASGFFWMCLATALAVTIAIGRWLMTGRAAYHPGAPWLVRLTGAWPTSHGQATPGPVPDSRADPYEPDSSTESLTAEAALTQPLSRSEVDSEHSADG